MRSHLDDPTISNYLARSLAPSHLQSLDDHVANCLPCTLAVEATSLDEDRWERRGLLGRLVPITR
jgi:hypothetical protein